MKKEMNHLQFIIFYSIGIIYAKGNDVNSGRIVNQGFPHHLLTFTLFSHMDAHNSKALCTLNINKIEKKEKIQNNQNFSRHFPT